MNLKVFFSLFAGLVLAGCANSGSDTGVMRRGAMGGDGMQGMSMKQCQEHMAMKNKGGMQMNSSMMKMDAMCKDTMKQGGSMAPMPGMSK